jgi:tetratricopeptide (TPR) repeat protein
MRRPQKKVSGTVSAGRAFVGQKHGTRKRFRTPFFALAAALILAGCATDRDQRLRDYSSDGLQLFQQGRFQDARESFQAALALKPDDADLLYNIGQCYDHQGANDQAEKCYVDCLARASDNVPCRFALASLQARTGRLADAKRMAEAWLASYPKQADPYALDGYLWHQSGDLPKAHGRLHQALELDPQNIHALIELGLVYEAMNRPDRAVVLYERVLDRDPNQPDVTRRLNALMARGVGRPRPE